MTVPPGNPSPAALPHLTATQAYGADSDSAPPPDGDHLDAIDLAELGAGDDGLAEGTPHAAEILLSREQFRQAFAAAFAITGGATGLRTLQEAPRQPTMPGAADALYDIAAESPWLRWLISPRSIWLQRVVAIGAFSVPLAGGVAAELRARRAPPASSSSSSSSSADAEKAA